MQKMKLAIFGRSHTQYSAGEIHLLFEKICSHKDISLQIYGPLEETLENIAGELLSKVEISFFSTCDGLAEDTDLFLSLGGDGTFLDSIPIVRGSMIPVAGINFGRLGFLTTASVGNGDSSIDELLEGRFSVEERALLHVDSPCTDTYPYCLNELTIQRRDQSMLEIRLRVNGVELPEYYSDGLIIATPTGSTAYSMSIGGPIVMPDSKVTIIAPIAPHNLNVRPLVVPDTASISFEYEGRGEDALLTLDNRSVILPKHTSVTVSKADFPVRRAAVDNSFIGALSQKLMWGQDKRNLK